jgi:hypothetical protein
MHLGVIPPYSPCQDCENIWGINATFEFYQKLIKKILKDEDVIAKIPAIVLPDFL